MSERIAICEVPWDERPEPFDGFPYLALRVSAGLHHYFLLPQQWQTEECMDFARTQIGRNQIGGALVLGPALAIWMHPNGGARCTDFVPRPAVPVSGLIHPCRDIQLDDELAQRQARFDDVAREAARCGLMAVANTENVLRRARPDELEALDGTGTSGVPVGLERCVKCGEWRGECRDPLDRFGAVIVIVSCSCENDSRCAKCDGMLGGHRADSCWFDEAEGALRFEPGDDALRHRCPAVISLECH